MSVAYSVMQCNARSHVRGRGGCNRYRAVAGGLLSLFRAVVLSTSAVRPCTAPVCQRHDEQPSPPTTLGKLVSDCGDVLEPCSAAGWFGWSLYRDKLSLRSTWLCSTRDCSATVTTAYLVWCRHWIRQVRCPRLCSIDDGMPCVVWLPVSYGCGCTKRE